MKKVSRRNFLKAVSVSAAASAFVALLNGCGASASSADTASSNSTADMAADAVNIGCTASLSTLNPLMVDATWINMYAATLLFSPLVAINPDGVFENILLDSIATEDNQTYTLHLSDAAVWSDGEPVTASDLKFTMKCLTSARLANATMMLSALVGTDDESGYRPDGVEDIEGVQVVDDKTCTFQFKYALSRNVFENGYAQYIYPVPEHILKDVPEEQLAAYDWFNQPDVIDGPYFVTAKDNDHYISYRANDKYWKGAPKIQYLNIKIVTGAQLLSGLQSGELDVVPPLLGTIDQADYDAVKALPNVDADYGARYSVESLFINCSAIPEKEIRQALLCAVDRNTIVDGLLDGEADICDGFGVPAGPYQPLYQRGCEPEAFDASRAAELVAEAKANGWDDTKTYQLYLNSGDDTLINAATVAQTYWEAAGIHVNLNTVDLGTLMGMCIDGSGDMYGVQYTYPPVDPSWDIQWVLGSWCFYTSDAVDEGIAGMQSAEDDAAYAAALAWIDADVTENVPVINLYVVGPLGAVSKRILGAKASMYGCLNNVQEWEIAQ